MNRQFGGFTTGSLVELLKQKMPDGGVARRIAPALPSSVISVRPLARRHGR